MSKLTIHTQIQLGDKVIAEGNPVEIYHVLMKILSALPEKCQTPFYLATVHGLSDKEVGVYLNCPTEKVREYIDYAQSFIRKNVNELKKEFEKIEKNGFHKSIYH